jgi:hypothetical protein
MLVKIYIKKSRNKRVKPKAELHLMHSAELEGLAAADASYPEGKM